MRNLLIVILLLFAEEVLSQEAEWTNYYGDLIINSLALEEDFIWEATNHGLVKIDKSNQRKTLYLSSNSGLPSNYVNKIMIDSKGIKWIGTNKGLAKFDGTNWIIYNYWDPEKFDNHIRDIAIDGSGNLWIIGFYGILTKFDGSGWTSYYHPAMTDLGTITIDSLGSKWIGLQYWAQPNMVGGLLKFDGANWIHYNYFNSGARMYTTSISIDNEGVKWIGDKYSGLTKFDGNSWTVFTKENSGIPSNTVFCITIDKNGNKWVGTDAGIAMFDNNSWTVYDANNSDIQFNSVHSLEIDAQGNKWVGADLAGLKKFDGNNWTTYRTNIYGMPVTSIYSIAVENSGIVWTGGYGTGILKINGTEWVVYDEVDLGMSYRPTVNAIAIGPQNIKWFCANYLGKYDDANWTFYTDNEFIRPRAIAIDEYGNKWLGIWAGDLVKYDGTTFTTYSLKDTPIRYAEINSIKIDSFGNKWLATSKGVGKFDGTNWTFYTTANSGLPNSNVTSIAIDAMDNTWIGTYGGLAKFGKGVWTTYDTKNSLIPEESIKAIDIDKFNNVWVCTNSKGLAKFDGVDWTIFNTTNSPLSSDYLSTVFIDESSNLWIGADRAITVIKAGITESVTYPNKFSSSGCLLRCYPNPFNSTTIIDYQTDVPGKVRIDIYNISGQWVRELTNEYKSAGKATTSWDGRDHSGNHVDSGIYYCLIETRDFRETKKLILSK